MISFSHAKGLAARSIEMDLDWLLENGESLLSEYYLEGDNLWIFFRKEDVFIPENKGLRRGSYAVSKKGSVRLIAEFPKDSPELLDYFKKLSDFFEKNNE